jgi:hypothetical protein
MNIFGKELNHYLVQVYSLNKTACQLKYVTVKCKHTLYILWRFYPIPSHGLHLWGFAITLRPTTLSRTVLNLWSARSRDLYLTTHNTHKRQTSVLPGEFEPTIPASEPRQVYALDRTATGID